MYFESSELGQSSCATPPLTRSHTVTISVDEEQRFSIIFTHFDNVTCYNVAGLPGQQPVLGSSDRVSEVCSGGGQVFDLLLHSGQYLHTVVGSLYTAGGENINRTRKRSKTLRLNLIAQKIHGASNIQDMSPSSKEPGESGGKTCKQSGHNHFLPQPILLFVYLLPSFLLYCAA